MGITKISLVVCSYNRAGLIVKCLSSLANQSLEKGLYEVIVVNNGSTDETQKVAEEFAITQPNFRVILEVKQGLSYARNRGYKEALGKYVAYIDDDAKALPDWAEKILTAFETVKPKPVAVGGMILPLYEKPPPSWFTDDLEIRTWGDEKCFLQLPGARYGFSGSNMAFQKSVLEQYGGFSASFGMKGDTLRFGEESELFSRIYKDFPLFWYDPEIKILHLVPERNMNLAYRMKRAYLSGISNALIRRTSLQAETNNATNAEGSPFKRIAGSLLAFIKQSCHCNPVKHAQFMAGVAGYLAALIYYKKIKD